ncbi:MAG: hypothetical protein FWE02_04175 [Defluviitaleaceae bacterium]|nr:hypothetical protein [Defluviitaleaceae bacterium]
MKDIFKEQIVKKVITTKDFMIFGALSFLVIFPGFMLAVLLSLMGLAGFAFLALLICGYIVFLIYSRFKLEYEYSVTNAELDIDVIYNKRKRKRAISLNLNSIEYFASIEYSENLQGVRVRRYSMKNGTHFILANVGNIKTKVVFDPNEELLTAIKKRLSTSKLRGTA